MICSNCQTSNADDYVFCVNCGAHVTAQNAPTPDVPTQFLPNQNIPPTQHILPPTRNIQTESNSIETRFLNRGQQGFSPRQNFMDSPVMPPFSGEQHFKKSNYGIFLGIAALALLLAVGGGTFYFFNKKSLGSEAFPDHLGMFAQNKDKNKVEEIKKQDFSNAIVAKDNLLKDDSLTTVEENPHLILYSDSKDIPLNDLKLVQLDTIKDDGSLKLLSFQAALIEDKTEMKQIRIPDGLANGKYAFALFDGYFDEGKHKFWAFQVKNGTKSNNDDALKSATILLKSKASAPTPETTATPTETEIQTNTKTQTQPTKPSALPREGSVAYCTSDNVIFRSGPSQSSAPLGKLYRGQRLYILGYSSNYEYFRDYYSNFAQVETDDGERGWVYAIYVK